MSGTYKITKLVNDVPGKFVAMASFNGKPAERVEVEVPNDMGIDEEGNPIVKPNLDSAFIASVLQKIADDANAPTTEVPSIQVDSDGQIII